VLQRKKIILSILSVAVALVGDYSVIIIVIIYTFCLTGPISLSVDLFVFVCILCVFLFHTAQLLYHCEHGGVDLMGLKPNPSDLSSSVL